MTRRESGQQAGKGRAEGSAERSRWKGAPSVAFLLGPQQLLLLSCPTHILRRPPSSFLPPNPLCVPASPCLGLNVPSSFPFSLLITASPHPPRGLPQLPDPRGAGLRECSWAAFQEESISTEMRMTLPPGTRTEAQADALSYRDSLSPGSLSVAEHQTVR